MEVGNDVETGPDVLRITISLMVNSGKKTTYENWKENYRDS